MHTEGEGKKATECLRTALREYNLKFGTILNDPDLASSRSLPEFKELREEARIGGENIGYSFNRDLKLISEVQAPFRGVGRFFYVALLLLQEFQPSLQYPDYSLQLKGLMVLLISGLLQEILQSTLQDSAGIVVFVALFIWDNKKEEEQLEQILWDETLSRLPLSLSTNRVVELVQLRDTVRPVILAGRKESISLTIQKAERFRTDLL